MKFGSRLVHLVVLQTKKSLCNLDVVLKSYEPLLSAVFGEREESCFRGLFDYPR